MINKKEIGRFCHQYGMEPIRTPTLQKNVYVVAFLV